MMRILVKLAIVGALVYAAKRAWDSYAGRTYSGGAVAPEPHPATGRDTATGTDPDAKYSGPGYEDKSLGQAVNDDMELVDRLMHETQGDEARAESRFNEESAGAPALQRQREGDRSA
jgi:hypothetical protein